MKRIFFSALVLLSFAVQADELASFNEVTKVVSQGKPITFVINLRECSFEMPLPVVTASITPNAVMIINNKRITASDRHFTLDNPLARGVPVFDYNKFDIDADGSASMTLTMMNAVSYEVLGTHEVKCSLGKGFKVFG